VKVGETATFRCVGSGIPTPTVGWYDERGNLLANGTTLTRENVQSTGRNPTFICIVSSDAGRAQKVVKLTVYGKLREFATIIIKSWPQALSALIILFFMFQMNRTWLKLTWTILIIRYPLMTEDASL
jgi:hypothetical protein